MNPNLNPSHARVSTRGIFSMLFGLGVLTAASSALAAEPDARPDRKPTPAEHMKHLAEELGLTDAQKAQVKTLMQAQRDKLAALRDDESLNRREKMMKFRELREANQAQIRAVLTPEQQAKFDAMPKPKPRDFQRGDGPRPE